MGGRSRVVQEPTAVVPVVAGAVTVVTLSGLMY
jgi:hypothetical protein